MHGVYQVITLLFMISTFHSVFGIEFESETPFYYTADDCETKDGVSVYKDNGGAGYPADPTQACEQGVATLKTQAYTMVFQTFVFMQLFNLINAKKLGDRDFNIFAGIFNNFIFIFILLLCFAVQVAMSNYGGRAVRCYPLTSEENVICCVIGAGELIWGVIIKFIPSDCSFFNWLAKSGFNEEAPTEEE